MTATYNCIATTTLGTATNSVSFTSIPNTFTDLVIVFVGSTASSDVLAFTFNSDTGSNYSDTYFFGNGSSAGTGRHTSATRIFGTNTDTSQGMNTVHIMNYANTNMFKSVAITGHRSTDNITFSGLWRSTSAISTVTFITNSGNNYTVGSMFSIYGIKAE